MNTPEQDCLTEKWSARAVGFIILPIALIIGFFSILLVPILGLIFALPLFIFSLALILAPDSKVCQLILKKNALDANN